MVKYPMLLSPLAIRGVTIKNRIIFPPWQFNWAHEDGYISEKLSAFYGSLARGGCGLVTIGAAIVSSDSVSRLYNRILRIDQDCYIESLAAVFLTLITRDVSQHCNWFISDGREFVVLPILF